MKMNKPHYIIKMRKITWALFKYVYISLNCCKK